MMIKRDAAHQKSTGRGLVAKKYINEVKELVVDPLLAELANVGLTLIHADNADEWWFDVSKLLQVRHERRAPASAAPSPSSSARASLAPPTGSDDDDENMIFDGIDDAGTEERTASSPARAGAATARARLSPGTCDA
jgi:hypothetical protein